MLKQVYVLENGLNFSYLNNGKEYVSHDGKWYFSKKLVGKVCDVISYEPEVDVYLVKLKEENEILEEKVPGVCVAKVVVVEKDFQQGIEGIKEVFYNTTTKRMYIRKKENELVFKWYTSPHMPIFDYVPLKTNVFIYDIKEEVGYRLWLWE